MRYFIGCKAKPATDYGKCIIIFTLPLHGEIDSSALSFFYGIVQHGLQSLAQ